MARPKKGYKVVKQGGRTFYRSDFTPYTTPHLDRMLTHVAKHRAKKIAKPATAAGSKKS